MFETAKVDLAEAVRLADEAGTGHRQVLDAFDSGHLNPEELAERLESEALPAWRGAEAKLAALREAGAEGETYELLSSSVHDHREATELLIEAIRTRDQSLHDRALAVWKSAEASSEKVRGGEGVTPE